MQKIGFEVSCEYIDFWNMNLNKVVLKQPSHNLLIREVKDCECERISEITYLCKNQSRGFNGEKAGFIKDWYETENTKILVAELDGVVVGVSLLSLYGFESEKGTILWIRLLAVEPKFQKLGIGATLITHAIKWGDNNGAKRSFLATDIYNDNAINLYQRIGYAKNEGRGQINMYLSR